MRRAIFRLWAIGVVGCGSTATAGDASTPDAQESDAVASDATDGTATDALGDSTDSAMDGGRTGALIPLYTYPTDGTWAAVIQAKTAHADVPIIATINPNSGPGTSQNSDYATGITALVTAGVTVIGYVPTGYGTSSYSATSMVEAAVHDYVTWYPNIQGIFFDEMSAHASTQGYYQTLATYVASQGLHVTVGNPGTAVPTTLLGIFTYLVIYENQSLPSVAQIDTDYATYGSAPFTYIAYGVPAMPSPATLQSLDQYVRYAFFTDLGGSNPYNALPSYFASEIAALGM